MNVATTYLILSIVAFLLGHTIGAKLRDKTANFTNAVLVSNSNRHATVDTTKADEWTLALTRSGNDWDSDRIEENAIISDPSMIAVNDDNKAAPTVGRVRQRRLQTCNVSNIWTWYKNVSRYDTKTRWASSLLGIYRYTYLQDINFPIAPSPVSNCAGSGASDDFFANYIGYVKFPITGDWQLSVESETASKVYIDEANLFINNDGRHKVKEKSAIVRIKQANEIRKIQVQYVREWVKNGTKGDSCGVIIRWKHSRLGKEVIPCSAWVKEIVKPDFNLTRLINTTKNNVTMYLGEVVGFCKREKKSFIDCKKLVLSNPLIAEARTIQSGAYKTQPETFYNQAVIQVDYRGYVLGVTPEFNGIVYYPLEWNGNPSKGPGARDVGPWDCKGLNHVQCCSMIEDDVSDPDLAGNYLACWVEKASWHDRVTNLYHEVFLNPIDSSINYVGGQDEVDAIEARERPVRDKLIQAIEDITFRTSVDTAAVKHIYISCLFFLRGVQEPRPTFIVIRNLIRKAESSGLLEDYKTKTFDIAGNLPINEKKLLAFVLSRIKDFLKVANKYPLDNNNGGEKYFFFTTTRANQASDYTQWSWYFHSWHPEPEIIHRCVAQRIHSYDCDILLDGVKVVFIYHRLLSDMYYNQVHIGSGFDGVVAGTQPHLNGIVGYPLPLNPWRGINNRTRMIGPWNCRGLLAWDCCNRILSSVPDPDINGKYLDCWIADTLLTDDNTGKQLQVIYDKTIPSNVWPSVIRATFEQIETIMASEREVNKNLTRDIIKVTKMTACPKTALVDLVNRIRHATRGDPRAQGIPYTMRENIRAMGIATALNVVNHQVLQFVFAQVTQIFLANNTFARNGTTNWGDEGNLVTLVNGDTVSKVPYGTPEAPFRYAINNPCSNGNFKYNECSRGCGAVFYTSQALRDALVSYAVNKTYGVESFGVVNDWDVGKISNMSKLFYNLFEFNEAIRCWNVSGATSMKLMFSGASTFNQSLAIWDVGNVTTMDEMFSGCSSFDRPLSQWNTSKLTSLRAMFQTASSFNQDISTWNVSKVTSMERTFLGASSFNQSLANWNISRVINMERTFLGASSFNQALDIWNVSGVFSMAWMFQGALAFNQPLGSWDVRKVIAMVEMFYQAFSFNQNLATWNFGNLTAMDGMFREATSFKQNLCVWFDKNPDIVLSNQPTVTSMFLQSACNFTSDPNFSNKKFMCSNCIETRPPTVQPTKYPTLNPTSHTYCRQQGWRYSDCCGACGFVFTQNWDLKSAVMLYDADKANGMASFGAINCWDVSQITGMNELFYGVSTFNEAIGCWDTSSVINMDGMFFGASSFNQPLATWNIPNVTFMGAMFDGASAFNQDLCSWYDKISTVPLGNHMFQGAGCTNPANPNFSTKVSFCAQCRDTSSPTLAPIMPPIAPYDNRCSQPFLKYNACCNGCGNYFGKKDDLRNALVFYDADKANAITSLGEINCWDVSLITEMDMLFMNLLIFDELISCWDVSKVVKMESAFHGCLAFNQPLASWDVSSATDMFGMFDHALAFNQPLATWDVSKVENLDAMFHTATAFNQDLATWDVSRAIRMAGMFYNASIFNQPLATWDVSKVLHMHWMFQFASSFNQPLVTWNVSNVVDMSYMFDGASTFNQNLCLWYDKINFVPPQAPELYWTASPLTVQMFESSGCTDPADPDFLTKLPFCARCYDTSAPTLAPVYKPSETQCSRQDWKYSACCGGCGTSFTSKGDLRNAIVLYDADKSSGINIFGVIDCWDVSQITVMDTLFTSLPKFNEAIGCWNVSNTINISGMFLGASAFNQPLDTWNIPSVMQMSQMFDGASSFNQDLCSWYAKITGVPEGSDVFQMSGCASRANPNFLTNQTFCATCKETPAPTEAPINAPQCSQDSWKFSACCGGCGAVFVSKEEIRNAAVAYDVDKVNGIALYGVINCWDISQVTEMDMVFMNLPTFNELISCWDVSNVIKTDGMFYGCTAFNQPLSAWNFPSVMYMGQMFNGASSFNQDLCSWYDKIVFVPEGSDVFLGSGCTDLSDPNFSTRKSFCKNCDAPANTQCSQPSFRFNGCCDNCGEVFGTKEALQSAVMLYDKNIMDGINTYGTINCWDISQITDISSLFAGLNKFNGLVSCWDTSNVVNMQGVFTGALGFDQPLARWDVSKVENMGGMFNSAMLFNQPLATWVVSKVTTMEYMFSDAQSFNQPIVTWDISHVENMFGFFLGAAFFNQPLADWDLSSVQVIGHAFKSAFAFNQNLCSWYDKINVTVTTVYTEHFFGVTACPNRNDPNWSTKQSFCANCY